ncbi:hypothetical protein [Leisingera caerulea]|uniref:Phage protein n=1 Tax=Leisingera caerulea TaxID=506591 RepID=A0A9Q9LVP3_LEICA|nr:hypothetical protein [Leisingera caerulea]UWQ52745.1 hypothetical protein K3721_12025 [Leisingera caerulea]
MIESIETTFTRGDVPSAPNASYVALEAGTLETDARDMIAAAWQQAEAYTGRSYYPVTAGQVVLKILGPELYTWPRHPFPAALTVEVWSQSDWVPHSEIYIPALGLIELEGPLLYRLTQVGTIDPGTPPQHVQQAVFNLACYQLIHSPARREFKSQNAGDSGFTRESLMGVMYGSGAGALLASEVRKP